MDKEADINAANMENNTALISTLSGGIHFKCVLSTIRCKENVDQRTRLIFRIRQDCRTAHSKGS